MTPNTAKDLPEAADSAAYVQLHTFSTAQMSSNAAVVIKGHRGSGTANSWRNLVIHEPSGTKLWFDLGISDDLSQYPQFVQQHLHKLFGVKAAPNSILDDLQSVEVDKSSINYIIPSHAHWDHIFPVAEHFPQAKLLCGPGTLRLTAESWPEHPNSHFDGRIWNSQNADLPIQELPDPVKDTDYWQKIGPFEHGHDFFGDGSFWLIRAPGHCQGNLIALVRTKNKLGQRRWVILAGDASHSYHLLRYPNAPFGDGLPLNASGTMHEDPAEARKILLQLYEIKEAYGDEMFIWPAHVDALEGIWEF